MSTESRISPSLEAVKQILAGQKADEDTVLGLPRRRPHSQRDDAQALACAALPEETPIKALIMYEQARVKAVAAVRAARKSRLKELQLANNSGGKLMLRQGPWAGQELDPVDLNGPKALPMPVEIPKTEAFSGVFNFLSSNGDPERLVAGDDPLPVGARIRRESISGTQFVEFDRGIVYTDGRLDLCKMVVGPTHIGALLDSLEKNQHITQFLLGNNIIATTGVKRIAAFIRKHPERIETWYLAGCHITTEPFKELVEAMAGSSRITNVWLKRNPLGAASVPSLVNLIINTPNLRTLDIENTELGDLGVEQLFRSLKGKQSSLRNIYLNALGVGIRGSRALAEYLDDPASHIESLFLSSNPIGDAGMAELAPSLGRHNSLLRISLTSIGLTHIGMSQICNTLASHPNLFTVDLGSSVTTKVHNQRYNYTDAQTIPAISRLISSPTMRMLVLARTALTKPELTELRTVVAKSNLVIFVATSFEKDSVWDTATWEVLVANHQKFYPGWRYCYQSDTDRFLRNTPDVRLIDSQYRVDDAKLRGHPTQLWDEGDPTWDLVLKDAEQL